MKKALKYILFVLISTLFPLALVYLYFYRKELSWIDSIAVTGILIATPWIGFFTGVGFLLVNRFLLKKHLDKKKHYLIRVLVYFIILILVCSSMFVSDLIYEIKDYFGLI